MLRVPWTPIRHDWYATVLRRSLFGCAHARTVSILIIYGLKAFLSYWNRWTKLHTALVFSLISGATSAVFLCLLLINNWWLLRTWLLLDRLTLTNTEIQYVRLGNLEQTWESQVRFRLVCAVTRWRAIIIRFNAVWCFFTCVCILQPEFVEKAISSMHSFALLSLVPWYSVTWVRRDSACYSSAFFAFYW
jgi:hypothetical protein